MTPFTETGDAVALDLTPAKTVDLVSGDPEEKREEIRAYFHATYDIDEKLYETLADDDAFYRRADPLRHPLIFYFGHTATFFVNKLMLARLVTHRVEPNLESIFAIGVDEMSWDDLNESHYDWPTVADVRAYRDRVRALVDDVITTLPISLPIGWDSPFWTIMMGIEHERIHLETSSVLIRQLPLECVEDHPFWKTCADSDEAPKNELLDVPGGHVVLGKAIDDRYYGWDCEYGRLEQDVQSFAASRFLVSNAEFHEFVDDGGYRQRDHWDEEGWNWREYRQAEHPTFWVPDGDGGWRLRLMLSEVPMRWDWPAEVNCLEARAFCAWKTAREGVTIRLPSEEEWSRLREVAGVPDVDEWEGAPGNLNLEYFASSCPVGRFEAGGFCDVVGNVWQWTETPVTGFPGFRVHPHYDDFSAPTFDLRHNIIKGGSWVSTGNEVIKDARYAFRRHFFQHAGFRYVRSEAPVKVRRDVYETDDLVAQYCEFHWGEDRFGVENFAAECAGICLDLTKDRGRERALDLGCAIGRSTFELARGFGHVTGLDFSARFIRIAEDMREKGYIQYVLPDEGELISYHEKRLEDFGLSGNESKVEFLQADACNLKPMHTDYDLVFAGNLLDRLYGPGKFLRMIHERIRPGGLLVIASPYTWLAEHTEREEWIGGFKRDGDNVTTLDGLDEILGVRFTRLGDPRGIELVIRETKRKFQHTVSELTVWEKK
jgi:5-histidylcysteine sulfoxide synthase/putative 4-mercaptohistidine N1-methyltranferase